MASVALSLLPLASAHAGLEQLKFRPALAAAAAEARLGLRIGFSCVPQPASASVRVQLPSQFSGLALPTGTTVGFRYTKGETIDRGGVQQLVTVQVEVETELTSAWTPDQQREWAAPGIVQGDCRAWYYGGWPDLEVSDFIHQLGQLTIVVRNENPLAPAGSSQASITAFRCGTPTPLALAHMVTIAGMPPGESAKVTNFSHTFPAQTDYFRVHLDWDNKVKESNENNNTYSGEDTCGRRLPGKVPPSLP